MFEVTCKYGVPTFNFEVPEPEGSTEKWNKRVTVSGITTVEPVDKTSDGKVIVNTLGDAFKPGLDKEFYDEQINVQFSARSFNVTALGDARGRVNSDTVTLTISKGNYTRTFAAGTLKLVEVTYSTSTAEDGSFYWDVNLTLVYRHLFKPGTTTEVGWQRLVANKGYRYKDASGNTQKSTTEVYLKSDSTLAATGDDAHLLQFNIEETIAFTGSGGILNGI